MKKIAVLLSGGVDSSVVVYELARQGLHPDCFYIKIGPEEQEEWDCSSEEDLDKLVLTAGKTYNLVFEYNSKVTESCFIDKTYSDKVNWSWESEIADLPFAEELSNSNVINEQEFMYTKVFNSTSTSDTNIKNKYCGFEYDNGSWRKSNQTLY